MKRIIIALLVTACLITATIPFVSAKNIDAFSNIELNGDTEKYIDDPDTNDLGGCGLPAQYVPGYGCGYTSLNDVIKFSNVDFGEGAKSVYINFAYGNDNGQTTDLSFYIDEYDDEAFCVGKAQIGYTGGFSIAEAKELVFPVEIDGGIHDFYVKFTTGNSGSFNYIRFDRDIHENEETAAVVYTGEPLKNSRILDVFTEELALCFGRKSNTQVSFTEDKHVVFTAIGDADYAYLTFGFTRYFEMTKAENIPEAEDAAYIVVKMKADEDILGTKFDMYGCSNEVMLEGDKSAYTCQVYEATGDWEYVLFDFSTAGEKWSGKMNNIRLDWNNGCKEGQSVEIAEIRLFDDEDEAYDFADQIGQDETREETTKKSAAETEAVTTEAEQITAVATEKSEETTAKPTGKSGCGGTVGAISVSAIVVLAYTIIRKKED